MSQNITLHQKINYFAEAAFRDNADKEYILARMAYRAEIFPQFHWASLHALEKYAKCILILMRTGRPSKDIRHEVRRSLDLISEKIDIQTSEQTNKFIDKLERFGARFRYHETSWFIRDCELAFLDRAVWEIRRYCNVALYSYIDNEFHSVKSDFYEKIKNIDRPSRDNTFVLNGFIEKTLENKKSASRSNLVWRNLYYSNSKRTSVLMPSHHRFQNVPFYTFPEIVEEASRYVLVPKEVITAYKKNLKGEKNEDKNGS